MKPKLFLFMPCYSQQLCDQTNTALIAVNGMLNRADMWAGFTSFAHYDITKVRNHALTFWYDHFPDSTHLLMWDDDMTADPDVVQSMIEFDHRVVGVIYPKRSEEGGFVVKLKEGGGTQYNTKGAGGAFLNVRGVGGGILLIRRDAVDAMLAHDPSIVQQLDDKRVDRVMAQKLNVNRVIGAFDTVEVEEGRLSEDFSFCERFRRAGGEIWALADKPIGHVGMIEYRDSFLRRMKNPNSANKLREMLKLDRLTNIVDIGCAPIDGEANYKPMLRAGLCKVLGFDANPHWALASQHPNEELVTEAIGHGFSEELKMSLVIGTSSFFDYDKETMEALPGMSQWVDIKERIPLHSKSLDNALQERQFYPVDFIKADIQGGELGALTSGMVQLAHASMVQLEVPFIPLYKGAPSFGDIDRFMREEGFLMHRFAHLKSWRVSNIEGFKPSESRQLLDGDVIWIRDWRKIENMMVDQWKHLAMLSHCVLEARDLTYRCLAALVDLGELDESVGKAYLAMCQ